MTKFWEQELENEQFFLDFVDPAWKLEMVNELQELYNECKVWVTKDGQWIPIDEMTNSHINNTINYLDRRISFFRKWQTALHKESKRRTSSPFNSKQLKKKNLKKR